MVPIIIDSRNPDKGSRQQRQNQREELPGVTSTVKEPNLSCQVHCQVSKSSKRPCTSLRPTHPGWNPSQSWETSINLGHHISVLVAREIRVHRSQQWRDLITCFEFHCLEREEHTWRVSTWETLVRLLHHRGWISTNDVSLCVIVLFKKMITQFKRVREVYEWIRTVWQFSWKFTQVLNRKLKTGNTNV